jgi:hypothetical protein
MDPSILKFRPALFGLAVLCFLMPFVTLSCPGMSFSFSGTEVAFGTTVQGQKLDGQPLAALALGLAALGLFLSFNAARSAMKAAAAAGGAGAILLLFLQSQIQIDAGRQGPVQVSFELAYWLAVLALGGGAWLSVAALKAPAVTPASSDKASPDVAPAPAESSTSFKPEDS